MPKALTITRDDYTAAEFREAATYSNDADATRRMLALALVLEGYKRGEAGKLCGMDRQTAGEPCDAAWQTFHATPGARRVKAP